MLYELNQNVAYICHLCGKLTQRSVTPFNLSRGGTDFYCSNELCGEKILSIKDKRDRYIFNVTCTACDAVHTFYVKHSSFWNDELCIFSCPNTSVDILFLGKDDKIKNELIKQNMLYREAEREISESASLGVYFEVIRIVNLFAKENKISCSVCDEKAFNIELVDSGILISCRACGASALLGLDNNSIRHLIDDGKITLK